MAYILESSIEAGKEKLACFNFQKIEEEFSELNHGGFRKKNEGVIEGIKVPHGGRWAAN